MSTLLITGLLLTHPLCISPFSIHKSPHLVGSSSALSFTSRSPIPSRLYNKSEGDDDDDVEAPEITGDWREFRNSLRTTLMDSEEEDTTPMATPWSSYINSPNTQKLRTQSPTLYSEYVSLLSSPSNPTYVVGEPELCGALARLPLTASVWFHGREHLKQEKRRKLLDPKAKPRKHDDDLYGEAVGRVNSMLFPSSSSGTPNKDMDDEMKQIVSAAVKNTNVWYKATESIINNRLNALAIKAVDSSGKIESGSLDEKDRSFLNRYVKSNEEWEELSIIVSHNGEGLKTEKSESVSLTINRPLSVGISDSLTKLILQGSFASKDSDSKKSENDEDHEYLERLYTEDFQQKFRDAFGKEGVAYVGGPDMQHLPALLLHGQRDLPGSTELSPGSGIFTGGMEAAVDSVLAKESSPSDYKFFVGRKVFAPGFLESYCRTGTYAPLHIPRPIALRQCISLPKPLFHEVLGLCGGEMEEISKIEILKRSDLQEDPGDQ